MVVGADHRGRCGVAVWRGAGPSSPLTARRHQPDHGWRFFSTRPTAWRRGRWVQASGRSRPPALPGPAGSGTSRGWGQWCSATASSSLLEGGVVRLRPATPLIPHHPTWQPGQAQIAAEGGAGRKPPKGADAPLDQSREAHHSARPLHSLRGGPVLLQVVADYQRLNVVQAAGRAGHEGASGPQYPGLSTAAPLVMRRLTARWGR